MSERIIPPQEALDRELKERAEAESEARAKCPRCGTPAQRFLRRCPECSRRYRSLARGEPAGTNFPANWARRN
jgi:hypothetical protein